MQGVSRAELKAKKILERYSRNFISRRDGHVIIKINDSGKTVTVWIRQRPITREALELFEKIIKKHEYDKLVLLKLYTEADYVKYEDLKTFNEIKINEY